MIPIDAIRKALELLPAKLNSAPAIVMMVAIGLQESRFLHRRQIRGPARGFWQFELGGVKGVMEHPASAAKARKFCADLGVPFDRKTIYRALEHNDVLAAGFARLLLWTDSRALPVNDAVDGWSYYVFNWRPGKPHRETWDDFYKQAQDYVGGLE